jgi:hypothetical protein
MGSAGGHKARYAAAALHDPGCPVFAPNPNWRRYSVTTSDAAIWLANAVRMGVMLT